MIAAVVAWPIAAAAAAGAQNLPTAAQRNVATVISSLRRAQSSATQIVTFADRHLPPVIVVRGKKAPAPPPVRHGTIETVAFSDPGQRPVTVLRGVPAAAISTDLAGAAAQTDLDLFSATRGADLDRAAFAVGGAESSHGTDPGMWRAEFDAPQGPMQVSAAAAADLGGGDRFDPVQNSVLGRAYLARLYRRYGNWSDAVSAYNWGPGNLDAWIAAGRPAIGLPLEVEHYRDRVLRAGGVRPGPDARLSRIGAQLPAP
jgi:hypothetical protein